MDLQQKAIEEERYFLVLVDDYSKATKVYTMKGKDEVYDCIVTYVNLVENLRGKRINRLRCGKGREFLYKERNYRKYF